VPAGAQALLHEAHGGIAAAMRAHGSEEQGQIERQAPRILAAAWG
jgi:hypothetical protein